jgi:hypothetical protein
MGNGYLPAAPEKNPARPARQSAVCGEDLIYISICSGGRINGRGIGKKYIAKFSGRITVASKATLLAVVVALTIDTRTAR